MQWYDYMRIVTSVLLLVALYGSARRAHAEWRDFQPRLRELWWVLNAALLFIAIGSIEAILQHIGWGSRVLLYFILSVIAAKATWRKGGYLKSEE